MKKYVKQAGALLIAATMAFSIAACGKDPNVAQSYDPETRPLTFAIGALDGTFSPFFTTSATDQQVVGMTQIGLISSDNDGNVVCGENEATVALDYSITSYDASGNVTEGNNADHTTYEFVIKNGIRFSDGVALTIDDVLFNLYVYLDPMYSGSSTVYSVDIQGLQAYRNNDPNASDSQESDDSSFTAEAEQRYYNLLTYSTDNKVEATEQILSDIERVREIYRKDLNSDWVSNVGGLESYEKEFTFTEDWQSFYYLEGMVTIETEQNAAGNYEAKKDENGRYITNLDDPANEYANSFTDDAVSAYMSDHSCERDQAIKEIAIEYVYDNYASDTGIRAGLQTILGGTTGSNVLDDFTQDAKDKFFSSQTGETVKSVRGITTRKTKSFNGKMKSNLKGEEHDVLSITINGIDPKAIWNFGFTVAPMHYYSDAETLADKEAYPYGVKARSKDFFDKVLNSTEKNSLPVGAGPYRASNPKGNASENPAEVNSAEFYSSSNVYYERNNYFYTVGDGIENAKIRRFVYAEVGENNILNRLKTGEIDYGQPSATQNNNNEVSTQAHLGSKLTKTNGYGYVGINPKFVPDLEVRQAIMKAMNTSMIITDYYVGGLATPLYRTMTSMSWAYPTDVTSPYYSFDEDGDEIEALVQKAGYTKGKDGIYAKDGKKLELKFTIAGSTDDHPALAMFNTAADILNDHGFKITVGTDVSALRKLATGNLAVWAAAWSSTIDPDMYQLYHKDSKTTNVKNWYYEGILNPSNTQYDRERDIVNELSDLIDDGRKTNNQDERATIYAAALEKVMELAVELPTYQRNDLSVYNKNVINPATFNKVDGEYKYSGLVDKVWEINYN